MKMRLGGVFRGVFILFTLYAYVNFKSNFILMGCICGLLGVCSFICCKIVKVMGSIMSVVVVLEIYMLISVFVIMNLSIR